MLRQPFNLGIGGAVQSGFQYARRDGYDFMAQVDGDGQHRADQLPRLIAAMDEDRTVDMVCGSRFLTDSGYPAPISRRTGIHIFAFLLSRIVGERVSDPTSGFRLYNRRAINLFARDYPHDYPEVEAVLMVHWHRLRMRRGAGEDAAAGGGVSSIRSGKSVYYMIKVLLAIFIGLARARPSPSRARRRPWPRPTESRRGVRDPACRDHRQRPAAAGDPRARAPAAAARALRAAVAVQRDRPARARDLARAARGHGAQIGVASPPNALFFIAFGFVLVLLLHFSLAVSRLADQTKVLAQRLALLEERQRRAERRSRTRPADGPRAGRTTARAGGRPG